VATWLREDAENSRKAGNTCAICNQYSKHYVLEPAYPCSVRYPYHLECVKKVLSDPESYSHRIVDYAVVVGDELALRKKRVERKLNKAKELSTALREG